MKKLNKTLLVTTIAGLAMASAMTFAMGPRGGQMNGQQMQQPEQNQQHMEMMQSQGRGMMNKGGMMQHGHGRMGGGFSVEFIEDTIELTEGQEAILEQIEAFNEAQAEAMDALREAHQSGEVEVTAETHLAHMAAHQQAQAESLQMWQDFYNTLSDEQKTALDEAITKPAQAGPRGRRGGRW